MRLSLSRALVDLGDVTKPALEKAMTDPDPRVAAHARATELLRQNPEAGFDAAVDEAKRVVALGPEHASAADAAAAAAAETAEPAGTAESTRAAKPEEPEKTEEAAGC